MKICVCGWYLDKFDEFYASLHRLNEKFPVHVISHKTSSYLNTIDLPYTIRENTGLEWGAYNHYLMKIWDGSDCVLFCHDDIELLPVVVNGEIHPPEFVFDYIANTKVDQAYIFGSRKEDVANYGQHGRMWFGSADFLSKCKEQGGFWFDDKNRGYISGKSPELKAAFGCFGYNAGIISFNSQLENIGGDIKRKIFIPSFDLAKRGKLTRSKLSYTQWMEKVSNIIARSKDRLNLGCGEKVLDGYINVDLFSPKADLQCDVKSLPHKNDFFDLVESHHLIEHLTKSDAIKALEEWKRVLKSGGHLFLSCPDLIANFESLRRLVDNRQGWDTHIKTVYGKTDEPGMAHKHGYCRQSLKATLEKAGFADVEVMEVIGLRPTPSLLALGCKP